MTKNSIPSKNQKLLDKNAKMGLLITVGVLVLIIIWVMIELSMNHY